MKQTAVEWLKQQLETYGGSQYCELEWETLDDLVKQAKEMEKQQIIKSNRDGIDMVIDKKPFTTGEQYYNETYGKQ